MSGFNMVTSLLWKNGYWIVFCHFHGWSPNSLGLLLRCSQSFLPLRWQKEGLRPFKSEALIWTSCSDFECHRFCVILCLFRQNHLRLLNFMMFALFFKVSICYYVVCKKVAISLSRLSLVRSKVSEGSVLVSVPSIQLFCTLLDESVRHVWRSVPVI